MLLLSWSQMRKLRPRQFQVFPWPHCHGNSNTSDTKTNIMRCYHILGTVCCTFSAFINLSSNCGLIWKSYIANTWSLIISEQGMNHWVKACIGPSCCRPCIKWFSWFFSGNMCWHRHHFMNEGTEAQVHELICQQSMSRNDECCCC